MKFTQICFLLMIVFHSCSPTSLINRVKGPDTLVSDILKNYPSFPDSLLTHSKNLGIQVIYSTIDRTGNNKAQFEDHHFGVDTSAYFYPASTVKLPVAILALQRLNELKIAGLNKNTTMITYSAGERLPGVQNDPTAIDGRPTISHYIKKILLVSDNDAFNRLYEFLGQEYINNTLHAMGYKDAEIIHRLSISLTEEENRLANPVRFSDSSGNMIYEKEAGRSNYTYAKRDTKLGIAYMQGEKKIMGPFDFSAKNRLGIETLHDITRSILFPESVPPNKRFNLKKEDYDFLRKYMSMRPGESVSPVYPKPEYWDNYVKMIYYGADKTTPDPNIRTFNKTGTAYGYLIESAYFVDYSKQIEFILSAVIYCNSDGVFNDNKYDYDKVGYPFFKQLGRAFYEYELQRERKKIPDLSSFKFDYR